MKIHKMRFPDRATLDALLADLVSGSDEEGNPTYAYSDWIDGKPVVLEPTVETPGEYNPDTGDTITPPTFKDEICVDVMAFADVPVPDAFAPYIVDPSVVRHHFQGVT